MQEHMEMSAECMSDVVTLLEQMKQMILPDLLDHRIAKYQREQRVSLGWVICIWLAYIMSKGDHRKVTMQDWVRGMRETLKQVTGLEIRETDFTDDRLTIALQYLSGDELWNQIERDLGQHLIRVYDLPQETVRVDATTVSGYREGGEGSLWQFGLSCDNPNLRQIKMMMSVLDPLGFPTALQLVPGQHADDGLYIPILEQTFRYLQRKGLLVVGDCKMSATAIRAYIQAAGDYYLTPLSQVGEVASQMQGWIEAGVAKGEDLSKVQISDEEGTYEIARGYEMKRFCTYAGQNWEERVLIVQSHAYTEAQQHYLEKRLIKARAALLALTPPVGQGKGQVKEEKMLVARAEAILEKQEVTGLLTYQYTRESRQEEKLVGSGRDGPNRPRQVIEHVRYQITEVQRNAQAIAKHVFPLRTRFSSTGTNFALNVFLGGALGDQLAIAPLFVKRDDQVVGLTRL